MKKTLTDADVAKALGWSIIEGTGFRIYNLYMRKKVDGKYTSERLIPPFTTSLDAIVAEIEARNIASWLVETDRTYKAARQFYAEIDGAHFVKAEAPTAPLALCHVLLAYLQENPVDKKAKGK